MTKYPILILTSRPRFITPPLPWFEISDFLNRHGYQTKVIRVENQNELESLFEVVSTPNHILVDPVLASRFRILGNLLKKSIRSVTLLGNYNTDPAFGRAVSLKPKNIRQWPEALLRHVVALAESDAQTASHPSSSFLA